MIDTLHPFPVAMFRLVATIRMSDSASVVLLRSLVHLSIANATSRYLSTGRIGPQKFERVLNPGTSDLHARVRRSTNCASPPALENADDLLHLYTRDRCHGEP